MQQHFSDLESCAKLSKERSGGGTEGDESDDALEEDEDDDAEEDDATDAEEEAEVEADDDEDVEEDDEASIFELRTSGLSKKSVCRKPNM
jgi:histone chaperone ASF1